MSQSQDAPSMKYSQSISRRKGSVQVLFTWRMRLRRVFRGVRKRLSVSGHCIGGEWIQSVLDLLTAGNTNGEGRAVRGGVRRRLAPNQWCWRCGGEKCYNKVWHSFVFMCMVRGGSSALTSVVYILICNVCVASFVAPCCQCCHTSQLTRWCDVITTLINTSDGMPDASRRVDSAVISYSNLSSNEPTRPS